MSVNRVIVLMLLVFVVEGSIVPWIIPEGFGDRIIPHFVFIFVMFAALYGNRHMALFLGAGFGLLQDIVYYGHLIGSHSYLMALIGYFAGVLFANRKPTIIMAVTVIGTACIMYDSILFMINKVFKITNLEYAGALISYILPSLFLQLVFMLICYVPLRRLFQSTQKVQLEDEED